MNECQLGSHCASDLSFPNDGSCGASSQVLLGTDTSSSEIRLFKEPLHCFLTRLLVGELVGVLSIFQTLTFYQIQDLQIFSPSL